MKKIILTLMGCLVASMFLFTENAQAQGFQVSGSVGITGSSVRTDSSEPSSTSSISFSPAIGWDLNKNWVVGIRTTLGVNTNKNGENKTSTYSLTLNPGEQAEYLLHLYAGSQLGGQNRVQLRFQGQFPGHIG